jgi:triphosphatase
MGVETELKLIVPPEVLARVPRLEAVRARKSGRARTQRLVTRYFDTPDRALHGAGIALRLRLTGDGWVQAVKSAGASLGGLQSRGEWESPVSGAVPVLDAIRSTPAFKVLGGARGFATLEQVFETDFTRVLMPLRFEDGSTAELCVDSGAVRSGARSAPIHEVEIELKHGSATCLFDIAEELLKVIPLRIGHGSKAELGHALADSPRRSAPVKARHPTLRKDMGWDEAFRTIVTACLTHLQANEPGMLIGRDPEYLHQMRIALRRLRSGFVAFRSHLDSAAPTAIEAALRATGKQLGVARDWDVLGTESLLPLRAAFQDDGAVGALVRRAQRMRGAHDRDAREFVASADYVRGILALGRFLVSPARNTAAAQESGLPAFAARMLQERHRRVRKLGERLSLGAQSPASRARLPHEELHRLRILAKKLRYAAEFFESLFHGGRARAYIRSLARLQDALGGLNDCATGLRLMTEIAAMPLRSATLQLDSELAMARAQGWMVGHRSRYLDQMPGRWREFEKQPRFWKKVLPAEDEPGVPDGSVAADAAAPVDRKDEQE